jgi:hypothetical protein
MGDVEALIRIRMKRPRFGEVGMANTRKPSPVHPPVFSTPPQLLPPAAAQPVTKEPESVEVSRYGMVVVEAHDDPM